MELYTNYLYLVSINLIHRVKFQTKKIYFVIMSSVFNTEKHIDIKYVLYSSVCNITYYCRSFVP